MTDGSQHRAPAGFLDERRLSVIFYSLFSGWMLAFLFEGRILYGLAADYGISPGGMVFYGIAALFAGALSCGFWIKTQQAAKRLFLGAYLFFIAVSFVFFFPPSALWTLGVAAGSFFSGACVAAWGFYFKSGTPKNARIKTAADTLVLSNVLMILLNTAAVYLSARVGLALGMLLLAGAFFFALRLPGSVSVSPARPEKKAAIAGFGGLFAFLCLFIAVITIASGLMYQVVMPAFENLTWLTGWYWAVPYVAAIRVIRNLPSKINRSYILYLGIAMIGLSFVAFVSLDRSAVSYLVVNTLMLGACGICDLFWWSILGEMLDFHENPALVLGGGLSANVLGILLGGLVGSAVLSGETQTMRSTLLALAVVCVTAALLPPLHSHLAALLKGRAFLEEFAGPAARAERFEKFENLSERESQVAYLLLEQKTYGPLPPSCPSAKTPSNTISKIFMLSLKSAAGPN
jgi:hypothetical protein